MKGDRCDYLHVYDPARTPICHLFATHGECNNKDCIFAHRAVDERSDECPYYNRGFCSKGAACRQAHVRRQPCPLYLQGFCPDGPACEYGHPRFELPDLDAQAEPRALEQPRTVRVRAMRARGARAWTERLLLALRAPARAYPPPADRPPPRDRGRAACASARFCACALGRAVRRSM